MCRGLFSLGVIMVLRGRGREDMDVSSCQMGKGVILDLYLQGVCWIGRAILELLLPLLLFKSMFKSSPLLLTMDNVNAKEVV